MTDSRFLDLNELKKSGQRIKSVCQDMKSVASLQNENFNETAKLESEINDISCKLGIKPEDEFNRKVNTKQKNSIKLEWDDELFLNENIDILDASIRKEIFKNPSLLPSLSDLEYGIIGITGLVASILDFLVVRIPKDINYLNNYMQKGSEFTKWLRSLGINEDGEIGNSFLKWCENVNKVSYDQSINSDIKGFRPHSHRLLSLGHDPLFGLIFGTLDMMNGSMTAFGTDGKLHIITNEIEFSSDKILSPIIWLGHIISDVCTKMGIPIPGWGFLQVLQFGSFGTKDRTIADLSKWMYLNGYDLRHFATMAISVAAIEIIVRGYHYLSEINNKEQLYNFHSSIVDREIRQLHSDLKLRKMLFLSHLIATSGNALKIFVYHGNPLAINLTQWIVFLKECVNMVKIVNRDKVPEKIIRNRDRINNKWEEIKNIKH